MYKTTTIQAKRTDGTIETVDVSAKFPAGLTDAIFAQMAAATKAAGRGDLLSYRVVVSAPSADEMAEIKAEDKKAKFMARAGFGA